MNKLLEKRGFAEYSFDRPCSQTHSEEANVNILQAAGFSNIQVFRFPIVGKTLCCTWPAMQLKSDYPSGLYIAVYKCMLQVDETVGLLFEKPIALDEYTTKGHDLVAVAFRPFFPVLDTLTAEDQLALKEEFYPQANSLGQSMLNSAGLVEDKHFDLWVTAHAAH